MRFSFIPPIQIIESFPIMSWLGKTGASFISASNENNVALASLKFDFALLKVEAPKEFSPLGPALSHRRKTDAEDGGSHQTARKLGALFEQLVPATPKLIAAYGQRVSEIIGIPGVNPEGLNKHGPFKAYIGADATALWAAATSGVAAIAMYLLASLLASEWDHKEAVSIWVELVNGRKKEILDAYLESSMVTESSILSTRQDISRKELALWDASARSWLRSANEAKAREVNQFLLISRNLSFKPSTGASTYEKVLHLWRMAMQIMEDLLCGRPHSIIDRSIPTAIVSWHLFPDLVVLSNEITNVQFGDKLLPKSATCTIGSTFNANDRHSVSHWSLALSHFRFYGGPVKVTSQEIFSRVDMQQLLVITLGSLLGAWQIQRNDILPVAQWFETLWDVLETCIPSQESPRLKGFEWLQCLVIGARFVIQSRGLQDKSVSQLLQFGIRRAKRFLCHSPFEIPPFFGLCNPYLFSGLKESSDTECSVRFMREIAQSIGFGNMDAIIIIIHNHGAFSGSVKPRYYEFVSVARFDHDTKKRSLDGQMVSTETHVRWVATPSPHAAESEAEAAIKSRVADIQKLGEQILESLSSHPFKELARLLCKYLQIDEQSLFTGIADTSPPSEIVQVARTASDSFEPISGDRYLGLFAREGFVRPRTTLTREYGLMRSMMLKTVSPSSSEALDLRNLKAGRLYDYLCRVASSEEMGQAVSKDQAYDVPGVTFLARNFQLPQLCVRSLHAIAMARVVYDSLKGSTISLKVVTSQCPIAEAHWVPSSYEAEQLEETVSTEDVPATNSLGPGPLIPLLRSPVPRMPSRQQTFACLAYFECGQDTLDPDSLDQALALSIDNSIYVASVLLSDPYVIVPGYRLERLTGNIGRSGLSILIAPQAPQIRELSDCYNLVEHKTYDLRRENNFKATSLHLHFTEWALPLEDTVSRTIDQDVFYVESVISVRDRGEWVADLDILSIDFPNLVRIKHDPCKIPSHRRSSYDYRCLDSWEELLDPPESMTVFRARGNWAARLAAVSLLTQMEKAHCTAVFGPDDFCLNCLEQTYSEHNISRVGLMDVESALPSFCID